jgi:hypothetical protein
MIDITQPCNVVKSLYFPGIMFYLNFETAFFMPAVKSSKALEVPLPNSFQASPPAWRTMFILSFKVR